MNSKEIEDQVKVKLKILHDLNPDNDSYYKGIVYIAHDFVQISGRRAMIDVLRRVPVEYFEGEGFRQHCQDKDFLAKTEDIAYLIMSFREQSNGEN